MTEWKAGDRAMVEIAEIVGSFAMLRNRRGGKDSLLLEILQPLPRAMTETIGAGGSGAYPTKEHAMQAAADRIGKKEAHAMTEHYYKPVGAGDGMGTVVVDEEGMRAELTAARARIAELGAALGTAQTDLAAQRERHAFIAENVAYPSTLPSYPAGAFETACDLIAREIRNSTP